MSHSPATVNLNKLCGNSPQCAPIPVTLTFALLTLKMVSESRVTWATSVPVLVFLGLSVLDLGPMYVIDKRQTASSLIGVGHNNGNIDLIPT